MNILYFFKDYDSFMSKWQYVHIFDELEHHGHHITVYNPLSYINPEEANEKLIPFIINSKIKFDLFLNCESDGFLFSSTVNEIKKLGIFTVLICFDNLHAPHLHKKIASSFDLVWLTSFETKWMFEKWGCKNIIVQTYAANPYKFNPNWGSSKSVVSFIGSPYGSRIPVLNFLTQSKIPCNVFSNALNESNPKKNNIPNIKISPFEEILRALSFNIGRKVLVAALLNRTIMKNKTKLDVNDFLHIYPSVPFAEMQDIYSNSALSLNIIDLRYTYLLENPLYKIHLRTFEIPMCGGLQISHYTKELAEYFEDEKEIVLYKSNEELISKSKFYLDPKNETLVKRMKQAARERAESDHTWIKRFNNIFDKMK